MANKTFSIVVPIYHNELNIPYTLPRLRNLETLLLRYRFEFVFIDDGSRDRSLQLLLEEQKKDPRIKIIKLSRNFGSVSAVQAGLNYTTGDCVGIIGADLQDPPELFVEMVKKWEGGKKVVIATREERADPFFQKLFSNTYYYFMEKFALDDYPRGGFDFVLIDKQIVEELKAISEKNTNIMSLIFWMGHNREILSYVRSKRQHGKSMWSFAKKLKHFIDSFVSFSYIPIRFMSFSGIVVAFLSFIYGIVVIVSHFFGNIPIKGWASLIAFISFLLGMIMVMLGVIGEYLWRILDETRNRPSYIIDEILIKKNKNKRMQ
jgi:dolichol-phosphate mannosyltransferase